VISAFRSLRQEDFKFEANLGYVARSASIKKKKGKKEAKVSSSTHTPYLEREI
jgi:hypothetical protein